MNKEDHFIDTDKLGDVLLEFSKNKSFLTKYTRYFIWKFDRIFKNIPDDVKNTQLLQTFKN